MANGILTITRLGTHAPLRQAAIVPSQPGPPRGTGTLSCSTRAPSSRSGVTEPPASDVHQLPDLAHRHVARGERDADRGIRRVVERRELQLARISEGLTRLHLA